MLVRLQAHLEVWLRGNKAVFTVLTQRSHLISKTIMGFMDKGDCPSESREWWRRAKLETIDANTRSEWVEHWKWWQNYGALKTFSEMKNVDHSVSGVSLCIQGSNEKQQCVQRVYKNIPLFTQNQLLHILNQTAPLSQCFIRAQGKQCAALTRRRQIILFQWLFQSNSKASTTIGNLL